MVGSHSSRPSDNSSRQPALPTGWGWLVSKQLNANPHCLCEDSDFTISTTLSAVPFVSLENINVPFFLNVRMSLKNQMYFDLQVVFNLPQSFEAFLSMTTKKKEENLCPVA